MTTHTHLPGPAAAQPAPLDNDAVCAILPSLYAWAHGHPLSPEAEALLRLSGAAVYEEVLARREQDRPGPRPLALCPPLKAA